MSEDERRLKAATALAEWMSAEGYRAISMQRYLEEARPGREDVLPSGTTVIRLFPGGYAGLLAAAQAIQDERETAATTPIEPGLRSRPSDLAERAGS